MWATRVQLVSNLDDDTLTYTIVEDDTPFVINSASGEVKVGSAGIAGDVPRYGH